MCDKLQAKPSAGKARFAGGTLSLHRVMCNTPQQGQRRGKTGGQKKRIITGMPLCERKKTKQRENDVARIKWSRDGNATDRWKTGTRH